MKRVLLVIVIYVVIISLAIPTGMIYCVAEISRWVADVSECLSDILELCLERVCNWDQENKQ